MASSDIEWTDRVWNCLRGCAPVSPGCARCYAMKQAHRFSGPGGAYEGLTKLGSKGPVWTGDVRLVPEKLDEPLRWRKPQKVFVNSMSDLFHDDVPDDFIAAVFAVMAACPQHTFQILTKRPERMRAWFQWVERSKPGYWHGRSGVLFAALERAAGADLVDKAWARVIAGPPADNLGDSCHDPKWPLPNVLLGVSVEDQERADERIPLLLETPAAVRFLSVEPLLGPVDLGLALCDLPPSTEWPSGKKKPAGPYPWKSRWVRLGRQVRSDLPFDPMVAQPGVYRASSNRWGALCVDTPSGPLGIKPAEFEVLPGGIDWVIVGGESGPGARRCDVRDVRRVVEQCRAAGVPVFVKQLGAFVVDRNDRFSFDEPAPAGHWPGEPSPQHVEHHINGHREDHQGADCRVHLHNRKGGNPDEWPADLRVREFPEVAS